MSLFLHSNQKILLALTIPFLCQYKLKKLYKLFKFSINSFLPLFFLQRSPLIVFRFRLQIEYLFVAALVEILFSQRVGRHFGIVFPVTVYVDGCI